MRNPRKPRTDLAAVRARLDGATGERYWRALEEVAETPEFLDALHHEFPEQADTWIDSLSRRGFLKVMGASLALGGLSACARQPIERIVPYVSAPEELVPGKSLYYATAFPFRGYGLGILAESAMGRPIKIEGNPSHPASLGATDALAQASVLTLWDPDRSQVVTESGRIRTWDDASNALAAAMKAQEPRRGAGLRILTGTVTSPTLAAQIEELLDRYPNARWHQYEPATRDAVRAGARAAFGRDVAVRYRLDAADVVLALDADFLYAEPGSVRYAHDLAAARRVRAGGKSSMTRLYAAETTPSVTGAAADHRLPVRGAAIAAMARTLARRLSAPGAAALPVSELSDSDARWLEVVARDLAAHRGSGLVAVGEHQPTEVHAIAHALNAALGNLGRTVALTDPVEAQPQDQAASMGELARAIDAGEVQVLLVLGANPAYATPAEIGFASRLAKVDATFHLGLYDDETAAVCRWHLPEAHPLETWSDIRAWDGTTTVMQPLIAPLYGGRSAHEVLAAALGKPGTSGHDLVKGRWQQERKGEGDFERFWERTLNDGVVAGTALPEIHPSLRPEGIREALARAAGAAAPADGLELVVRPDPTVWDGRFANNGWLQELPKPLTKLTWDNAAIVGPSTAERLGLDNGDILALDYRGRSVEGPVWILPGQADGAVTVHLGYGRRSAGRVGTGAGFDAYAIVTLADPGGGPGLALRKTGRRTILAVTHTHHTMEGRDLARQGTLAAFGARPDFAQKMDEPPPPGLTLYPGYTYSGYAWGMSVDTSACIGCNACVVACQAENNIAVVGKEQVLKNREMHWIRIDRYYEGGLDAPRTLHQPIPCMHCENAPCELVCPVGATTHSSEGLNQMIYNRCIGTRYCSNNCPYKVRRFNFLLYSDETTPSRAMLYNPDVTVRGRGVMEKCTFCVQRIQEAKIEAKRLGVPLKDGDIRSACEQACPAGAIVFGDINDPESRVSREKAQPLSYGLLTGLNTRPRTTYLAKLRNPNPDLDEGGA